MTWCEQINEFIHFTLPFVCIVLGIMAAGWIWEYVRGKR